jgi:hypothetical protein
MDDEVAESYLLDAIVTLVDAKHAPQQLNDRQEARRQVGFCRPDLSSASRSWSAPKSSMRSPTA